MPLGQIAELVNIGTLAAFVLVCGVVVALRFRQPELNRPFRVPFGPVIPALGALACLYLMANLPAQTWARFFIWMAVGLVVYFSYSRSRSRLAAASEF